MRTSERLNKLYAKRVNCEAHVEHARAELADAQKRLTDKTLSPPGDGTMIEIAGRTYQFDDLQAHVRGWRDALRKEKAALSAITREISNVERRVRVKNAVKS